MKVVCSVCKNDPVRIGESKETQDPQEALYWSHQHLLQFGHKCDIVI